MERNILAETWTQRPARTLPPTLPEDPSRGRGGNRRCVACACDRVPLSPAEKSRERAPIGRQCLEALQGAAQRAATGAGSLEEALSTLGELREQARGVRLESGEGGEGRVPSACVLEKRIGGNTKAGLDVRGGAGRPGRRP